MSVMIEAINAHRAAWQAFQDAPEVEASRAETLEAEAMNTVLWTSAVDLADVEALTVHLRWYTTEEEGQAGAAAHAMFAALLILDEEIQTMGAKGKSSARTLDIISTIVLVVLYCFTRPLRWTAIGSTALADRADAAARFAAKPFVKWVKR